MRRHPIIPPVELYVPRLNIPAGSPFGTLNTTPTTVVASLPFATSSIRVEMVNASGSRYHRMCLVANTGNGDVIIADGLSSDQPLSSGNYFGWAIDLPLRLPAGAHLKANNRSWYTASASMNCSFRIRGRAPGIFPGAGGRIVDLTEYDPTSTVRPLAHKAFTGVVGEVTSWGAIHQSLPHDVSQFWVQPTVAGSNAARTGIALDYEISTGAEGFEDQGIIARFSGMNGAALAQAPIPIMKRLKAGQRLSWRAINTSASVTTTNAIGLVAYGVAA